MDNSEKNTLPASAMGLATLNQENVKAPPNVGATASEPVPRILYPTILISVHGVLKDEVKKRLRKDNTNFLVIGILGQQEVGKSAILNILANDVPGYDYYGKIFVRDESFFPTKSKVRKWGSRDNANAMHILMTNDRKFLIDTPPLLKQRYSGDRNEREMKDLHNIVVVMSVCHLVIVVQDEFFDFELMRLLQTAESMLPIIPTEKHRLSVHYPHILFVKNLAKRDDFLPRQQTLMHNLIWEFFKTSKCHVSGNIGKRENDRNNLNSYLLPIIIGSEASFYHRSLQTMINELRQKAFQAPHGPIVGVQMTEAKWFEYLAQVNKMTQQELLQTSSREHFNLSSQLCGFGKSRFFNYQ